MQVFPLKLVSEAAQARVTAPLRIAMGIFAVAAPAQGFSQDSRQFLLDSFDISSSAGYTVINDEFTTASLLGLTSERAMCQELVSQEWSAPQS